MASSRGSNNDNTKKKQSHKRDLFYTFLFCCSKDKFILRYVVLTVHNTRMLYVYFVSQPNYMFFNFSLCVWKYLTVNKQTNKYFPIWKCIICSLFYFQFCMMMKPILLKFYYLFIFYEQNVHPFLGCHCRNNCIHISGKLNLSVKFSSEQENDWHVFSKYEDRIFTIFRILLYAFSSNNKDTLRIYLIWRP